VVANVNANGVCVRPSNVQARGAFPFAFSNEAGLRSLSVIVSSSHCLVSRASARKGTMGQWDETMRRSRSVIIVYVYASPRASAPLGRMRAVDIDIDNCGAWPDVSCTG
jgi:hypothetical protein